MKHELKIKKISDTTVNSQDVAGETTYTMVLEDPKTGMPKVTIKSEERFLGYKPGMSLTLEFKNNQKTLNESIKMPGSKPAGRKVEAKEIIPKKVNVGKLKNYEVKNKPSAKEIAKDIDNLVKKTILGKKKTTKKK